MALRSYDADLAGFHTVTIQNWTLIDEDGSLVDSNFTVSEEDFLAPIIPANDPARNGQFDVLMTGPNLLRLDSAKEMHALRAKGRESNDEVKALFQAPRIKVNEADNDLVAPSTILTEAKNYKVFKRLVKKLSIFPTLHDLQRSKAANTYQPVKATDKRRYGYLNCTVFQVREFLAKYLIQERNGCLPYLYQVEYSNSSPNVLMAALNGAKTADESRSEREQNRLARAYRQANQVRPRLAQLEALPLRDAHLRPARPPIRPPINNNEGRQPNQEGDDAQLPTVPEVRPAEGVNNEEPRPAQPIDNSILTQQPIEDVEEAAMPAEDNPGADDILQPEAAAHQDTQVQDEDEDAAGYSGIDDDDAACIFSEDNNNNMSVQPLDEVESLPGGDSGINDRNARGFEHGFNRSSIDGANLADPQFDFLESGSIFGGESPIEGIRPFSREARINIDDDDSRDGYGNRANGDNLSMDGLQSDIGDTVELPNRCADVYNSFEDSYLQGQAGYPNSEDDVTLPSRCEDVYGEWNGQFKEASVAAREILPPARTPEARVGNKQSRLRATTSQARRQQRPSAADVDFTPFSLTKCPLASHRESSHSTAVQRLHYSKRTNNIFGSEEGSAKKAKLSLSPVSCDSNGSLGENDDSLCQMGWSSIVDDKGTCVPLEGYDNFRSEDGGVMRMYYRPKPDHDRSDEPVVTRGGDNQSHGSSFGGEGNEQKEDKDATSDSEEQVGSEDDPELFDNKLGRAQLRRRHLRARLAVHALDLEQRQRQRQLERDLLVLDTQKRLLAAKERMAKTKAMLEAGRMMMTE